MQIYVAKNGQQLGPFDVAETQRKLASGEVSLDDLAWAEGEAEWVPLSSLAVKLGLQIGKSAEAQSSSISLPAELASLPGISDALAFSLVTGTVLGALLRTESRKVVTGRRSQAFNPIGVAVKGSEIKEDVNIDIQEFFLNPIDGGVQLPIAVEAQGFRVADGHKVTAVVATVDGMSQALAVFNHNTRQRGASLDQEMMAMAKSQTKTVGIVALVLIVISGVIGLKFNSWIVFGIAGAALFFAEYKLLGIIARGLRTDEAFNSLPGHLGKCLDFAERAQA